MRFSEAERLKPAHYPPVVGALAVIALRVFLFL